MNKNPGFQKPFETMCSPFWNFFTGMRFKIQIYRKKGVVPNKLSVAAEKQTKRKALQILHNVQSPSLCPFWMWKTLAECPFVIQSLRFLPRFILFSLFFYSTVEPFSLFCFDVYKPAKPQTPVEVQSSLTVHGAACEPLLSFACSLSPPLSLYLSASLSLSLSLTGLRGPAPLAAKEDAMFTPCVPAHWLPGEWLASLASLAPGVRALLPAVPIGWFLIAVQTKRGDTTW